MSKKPLVLMVLDGWGYREEISHNAIAAAHTPQWDHWWKTCPHIILNASGHAVGLPDAQMGNSEVGHMHIGAGRIILQDLTRINQAIADHSFMQNELLIETIHTLKKTNKTFHVMGLLSPGGVHSHENHLFEFLKLCAKHQFFNVILHLFLDGRDTSPQSARQSIALLEKNLTQYPVAQIGSLSGRYYAMDRDNRWARIEPVYCLLTEGLSKEQAATPLEALEAYYARGIYDEFIPPTRIGPSRPAEENDAVFFFNFRSDRARQLTEALISPEFKGFERRKKPKLAYFISMTQYADYLNTQCVFPPHTLQNSLGEILSQRGLHQLRIAETEKYAHVTFFFNGGSEQIFTHETRVLIPSPDVATYDKKPEMSAQLLTDTIVDAILNGKYDVIICNFANADMVGHTGDFNATVLAIECLDQSMAKIYNAIETVKGQLLITADHGNAECMFDNETHQPHTAHTNDPVPLLYVGHPGWEFIQKSGSLIDIAPTILTLLNITPAVEMTGTPLLKQNHQGT
jgi:2,3-bisphosphoglycerate-independent phosphoglycerate mutase